MKTDFFAGSKWVNLLLVTLLLAMLLYLGRQLFIPISYALLISFVLYPMCKWMERKGFSKSMAILTGVSLIVIFFLLMLLILFWQFRVFLDEWPRLRVQLLSLEVDLNRALTDRLGFPEGQISRWSSGFFEGTGGSLLALGQSVGSFFMGLVMIFIIPVFSFLILLYRGRLVTVLYGLFPEAKRNRIAEVVRLAIHTYYSFIKGMIVVYAVVGVLNSIGLLALGIPHAILFGFLTAIMTFIPYVGILVAALLPISFAWLTYNSIWYPLGVIAVFSFVQYLEANIIFPWAVSHRLQLNTLITLVAIIAGGILWGASGMILFVPFAAILKLVADRMEGWELLSTLLGDDTPKRKISPPAR